LVDTVSISGSSLRELVKEPAISNGTSVAVGRVGLSEGVVAESDLAFDTGLPRREDVELVPDIGMPFFCVLLRNVLSLGATFEILDDRGAGTPAACWAALSNGVNMASMFSIHGSITVPWAGREGFPPRCFLVTCSN